MATVPPTAPELIERARTAGTIDEPTAHRYQVLAAIAPGRLPKGYAGAAADSPIFPTGEAFAAQTYARAMNADDQQALRAVFSAPDDPAFGRFPTSAARIGSYGDVTSSCFQDYVESKEFRNAERFIQVAPPIETAHFRIYPSCLSYKSELCLPKIIERVEKALDANISNVGSVAFQGKFGGYLDSVYDYYAKTLGMTAPSAAANADFISIKADGKIPVYTLDCKTREDAFASPYGHIMMGLQMGFEDKYVSHGALPHELFHLFQSATLGTKFPPIADDDNWPAEAAALYIEDVVTSDLRRWVERPPPDAPTPRWFFPYYRSLHCPEESFFSGTKGGPCSGRTHDLRGSAGTYGKFLFFKFLANRKGTTYPAPGIKDFYASYKSNNGKLEKTISDADISEFQLALLADASDQTYFSARDRDAFYNAGKPSLDVDPTSADRYTFVLRASAVKANGGWRVAPSDSPGSGLPPFDGTLPLRPRATHRWLIEIPSELRTPKDPLNPVLVITIESQPTDASIAMMMVPLDDVGGAPAKQFDAAQVKGSRYTRVKLDGYTSFLAKGKSFANVLVVLTNQEPVGGRSITYKVGFTFADKGAAACVDHYEKWFVDRCTQPMCVKADNQAECATNVKQSARGDVSHFCNFLTLPFISPLDRPYLDAGDDNKWATRICKDGCSPGKTLAGLVSVHEWPELECKDIVSNIGK